jgi:hypothetical protein
MRKVAPRTHTMCFGVLGDAGALAEPALLDLHG